MKEYDFIIADTVFELTQQLNKGIQHRWELHSFTYNHDEKLYVAVLWRNK